MTAALKLDLSARTFAVALLATVVALAAGAWFVSIAPKHSKASTLDTSIQQAQTKLSTLQAAQHAQPTGTQAKQFGALSAALPSALAMPQVVDQLNTIAREAGVTLDTVTPGAAVLGIGYEAVPLTVVIDGRYFSVEKFLNLMRNQVQVHKTSVHAHGRLFDVQGFTLNQTEPAPSVTATLTMNAFYYTSQVAAPPVTSTDGTTTTPAPAN